MALILLDGIVSDLPEANERWLSFGMRKLLTILNAMVRDNAAWNPALHLA